MSVWERLRLLSGQSGNYLVSRAAALNVQLNMADTFPIVNKDLILRKKPR